MPGAHIAPEQHPFGQLNGSHAAPLLLLVAAPLVDAPLLLLVDAPLVDAPLVDAPPPLPLPALVPVTLPLVLELPPPLELVVEASPAPTLLSPGAPPPPVSMRPPFAQATNAREMLVRAVMKRAARVISTPGR